jgi:hypothetical protein
MENDKDKVESKEPDPLTRVLALETSGKSPLRNLCKLCNSPFRRQAEEMYEKDQNASAVKRWLETQGEIIHVTNVSHHLKNHFKNQEQLAVMAEYGENVRAMMDTKRSLLNDAEFTLVVGLIELARVIALPTGGDFSKEQVRNDLINKTIRSIREGQDMVMKICDVDGRVKEVKEKFLKAFATRINNAKTQEEKNAYAAALQGFQAGGE